MKPKKPSVRQKPDALAGTDKPTSGENAVSIGRDMMTMADPTMPGYYKSRNIVSNVPATRNVETGGQDRFNTLTHQSRPLPDNGVDNIGDEPRPRHAHLHDNGAVMVPHGAVKGGPGPKAPADTMALKQRMDMNNAHMSSAMNGAIRTQNDLSSNVGPNEFNKNMNEFEANRDQLFAREDSLAAYRKGTKPK